MHYIAILYERTIRERDSHQEDITLRGFDSATWVPAEFSHLQLPVNAIAFDICPTSRDLYLERVLSMTREPTWERYQGRVIDEIYKQIHKKCENYCSSSRLADFDLYNHLLTNQEALLAKAKRKHVDKLRQIESLPTAPQIQLFDEGLRKLIRFEAKITSAFIQFEISRLASSSPGRLFSEYFNFNTDLPLTARKQGFADPATPDFVYRHEIIGDIKFGKWQRFFEYTVLAYALAYEESTGHNMDYGAILPVELPSNRPVPTHYQVGIIYLGDKLRKRFIALRDRKLQIVGEKRDPGIPEKKKYCDQKCPFLSHCWSTTNG